LFQRQEAKGEIDVKLRRKPSGAGAAGTLYAAELRRGVPDSGYRWMLFWYSGVGDSVTSEAIHPGDEAGWELVYASDEERRRLRETTYLFD
jgi:hypothetical protein